MISTAQSQDIFTWNKNKPISFVDNVALLVYLVNTRFNTFSFYGFIRHPALHSCRLPACATVSRNTSPQSWKWPGCSSSKSRARVKEQWNHSLPLLKAAGAVSESALTWRCNSAVALSVHWSACFLNLASKELHRSTLNSARNLKFFLSKAKHRNTLRTKMRTLKIKYATSQPNDLFHVKIQVSHIFGEFPITFFKAVNSITVNPPLPFPISTKKNCWQWKN